MRACRSVVKWRNYFRCCNLTRINKIPESLVRMTRPSLWSQTPPRIIRKTLSGDCPPTPAEILSRSNMAKMQLTVITMMTTMTETGCKDYSRSMQDSLATLRMSLTDPPPPPQVLSGPKLTRQHKRNSRTWWSWPMRSFLRARPMAASRCQ